MYLPNRVGEHVCLEIAANVNSSPFGADVTTFGGTASAHQVHTRSATLNENITADNLIQAPLMTISQGETFCYGRFIDGTHEADIPQQYVVSGHLQARLNVDNNGLNVGLFVGRLDSGSVTVNYTGKPNTVSHGIPLPIQVHSNDGLIHASYQGSFIDGKFSTAQDFQTLPIAAYWCLGHDSGADVNIALLRASISIFNYRRAIEVFDPLR